MSCEQWRRELTEFMEDTLPAPERQQMAAHLEQCPDCRRQWQQFQQTVAALHQLPAMPAPGGLPARISRAVRAERPLFGYRISWQALGAAAAAACLLVGFWAVFSYQRSPVLTARREASQTAVPRAPEAEEAKLFGSLAEALEPSPALSPPPASKPVSAKTVSPTLSPPQRPAPNSAPAPSLRTPPQPEPVTSPPAPVEAEQLVVAGAPLGHAEEGAAPEPVRAPAGEAFALSRVAGEAEDRSLAEERITLGPDGAAGPRAKELTAGVKVTAIPSADRVVGQKLSIKVIIEPDIDVHQAMVTVKPAGQLRLSAPDGIIYRGELKGKVHNNITFGVIADEPGTHRLTIELSSEVPGISATVPVSIPGFQLPQTPPPDAPQPENE